ncbi:MAG: hypothetical protein LBI63_06195 [Candidatus Ancillula sp.]|jgi:indolepyruvate decarboxylase|nr:hypothetical protein [Candidatus Ancillula sp.]
MPGDVLCANEIPELITVGQYLTKRLVQHGVRHLFGLPGDFNLQILDEMISSDDLSWIGGTNELNAGYAADGYARAGQLGAFITTYGVGELSAVNAVAGSYAENVPVVHIVGIPDVDKLAVNKAWHHTLTDGDYEHFARVFDEMTVSGVFIDKRFLKTDGSYDPVKITEALDKVIADVLTYSRPGYIGIPNDVAMLEVPSEPLKTPLQIVIAPEVALKQFKEDLKDRLKEYAQTNQNPFTILAGMLVYRRNQQKNIAALADLPCVKIASQINTSTLLNADHPNYLGLYCGGITPNPKVRKIIDSAPLPILIGVLFGEIALGNFTQKFNVNQAIELGLNDARIGFANYTGITLGQSVPVLYNCLLELIAEGIVDENNLKELDVLNQIDDKMPEISENTALEQSTFWAEIENWFNTTDQQLNIISDLGTCFFGLLEIRMPKNANLMTQNIWGSIGYALPATVGVNLLHADKRNVLFSGDGAAQLTIQDLSGFEAQGLKPIIFIVNNDGYTIERSIQKPQANYHEIRAFDWKALAKGFAPSFATYTVTTIGQLRRAVEQASADNSCGHFIEVKIPAVDFPLLLKRWTPASDDE